MRVGRILCRGKCFATMPFRQTCCRQGTVGAVANSATAGRFPAERRRVLLDDCRLVVLQRLLPPETKPTRAYVCTCEDRLRSRGVTAVLCHSKSMFDSSVVCLATAKRLCKQELDFVRLDIVCCHAVWHVVCCHAVWRACRNLISFDSMWQSSLSCGSICGSSCRVNPNRKTTQPCEGSEHSTNEPKSNSLLGHTAKPLEPLQPGPYRANACCPKRCCRRCPTARMHI